MGFFDRSKKVKKADPVPPPKDRPVLPPHQFHPSPTTLPPPQARQEWHGALYHSPPAFQPAGLLPPPPGWVPTPQPPPPYHQGNPPYGPVIVNHHYHFATHSPSSAPLPQRPHTSSGGLGKLNRGTLVPGAQHIPPGTGVTPLVDNGLPSWNSYGTQPLNQDAALYDQLSAQFNDVMTSIDRDRYAGDEKDLFIWQPESALEPDIASQPPSTDRGFTSDWGFSKKTRKTNPRSSSKGQTATVAASIVSANCFAKVELYANSRLPMDLPPLRLYIPTYPLLCLAAQFSERAYEKPRGAERETHFDANWRGGTKSMVIKSVPMDYMNTIVFAIRGTATFMDWVVNLNMAPASPAGFLDDTGNLCHTGFLAVARGMIKPVAARLRQLLEEDPGRASYSLLITGHSAGGAVASLLYSHMLSTSKAAESELNILSGCFRRIHCVTFGTPPVSLLPLTKPDRPQLRKSLFLSFVNEGDPVARADPAYVRSLILLYTSPPPPMGLGGSTSSMAPTAPGRTGAGNGSGGRTPREKYSKNSLASSTKTGKSGSGRSSTRPPPSASPTSTSSAGPIWKVPPCTLSNAGRIVVLRSGNPKARLKGKKTVEERLNEGVVAQITTDQQLRTVVWGDPVSHLMKLYAGRIETLAVGAVTARGY